MYLFQFLCWPYVVKQVMNRRKFVVLKYNLYVVHQFQSIPLYFPLLIKRCIIDIKYGYVDLFINSSRTILESSS